MYYFGFESFLILAIILFIRYFVWRGRYGQINAKLTSLDARISDLRTEMQKIAATQRSAIATAVQTPSTQPNELSDDARGHQATVETEAPPTALEDVPAEASGRPSTTPSIPLGSASDPTPLYPSATEMPDWTMPRTEKPAPRPSLAASIRARIERAGGGAELEALIGGNWLNKVGVGALVIGMVLFIRYTLAYVGPLGKVGLGVALGLTLLVGGVGLERRQRYTLFARPIIGGGWALLYFTAYAAHNFDAARVIENPAVGLLAMITVAAGMIFHSLRYRAEMVTGVAYVLAFLAIDISPLGLYSLLASALLAASLVVLLWRFAWYRLALGAVIATYGTHILWMSSATPIIPLPPQAFWINEALLALSWVTFAACDFLRKPDSDLQRQLMLATTALNTAAVTYLSTILLDSAFPHAHYLLAAAISGVAVVAATLAFWRGRTEPYRFYGLVAGAAAAVAIFLGVPEWNAPGELLLTGWGVLTAAILAVGLWRREVLFRTEAYVVGTLAAGAAVIVSIFDAAGPSITATDSMALRWAALLSAAAALFGGEWVLFRMRERLVKGEDSVGMFAGYAAAGLVAGLIFRDASAAYLGIVWLVVSASAVEFGLRIGHVHSRFRGYALMLGGFAALIFNNSNLLFASMDPLPAPYRWLVLLAGAVAFFAVAWRLRTSTARTTAVEILIATFGIYAGTLLLALIAWNELPTASVAVAWAFVALALYEAGVRVPERALRFAAYGLAAAAWGRLFLVDFLAVGTVGPISTRVLAVIPVAALLYYFRHGVVEAGTESWAKVESRLPVFFSFAATIAIFALARFEFGRSDSVVIWSALTVVLLSVGVRTKLWDYRIQAYLVGLAAFARSWTTNFYLTGDFFGVPERVATTIPVILSLFALGLLWRRERSELATTTSGLIRPVAWIDAHSSQIGNGLATALVALLIYYSVSGNVLTIAWAIEGLAVTAGGFLLRERTLRLSGLGLVVLCLLKGIVIDLAGIDPIFRIVSFILLGAILVGISFAYTRYREVLKTYL